MSTASSPRTTGHRPLDASDLNAVAATLHRAGRTIESTVSGSSMGRTLPDGCRIRIIPCSSDEVREGQIVACIQNDLLSAHRFVRRGRVWKAGGYFLTQGDGWVICDPPRHVSTIVGVVAELFDGAAWRTPPDRANRSTAAVSARIHVFMAGLLLGVHPRMAGAWTRGMIAVYTLRENARKWWAART